MSKVILAISKQIQEQYVQQFIEHKGLIYCAHIQLNKVQPRVMTFFRGSLLDIKIKQCTDKCRKPIKMDDAAVFTRYGWPSVKDIISLIDKGI